MKREEGVGIRQRAQQEAVFAFLECPESHGVTENIKRIDTHGAVIFLVGDNAYKIKRAVRYSFMDFSTLDKRRAVCEAEVAINSANAPDLYIGVLPIIQTNKGLQLGNDKNAGQGHIVEWAVHMKRFNEEATLDRLAEMGHLPPDIARSLAAMVVHAHQRAPAAASPLASVKELKRYISRNAEALVARPDIFPPEEVIAVEKASLAALEKSRELLISRAESGQVCRCHGDMHLRNIVLIENAPVLFDAIEFDESIACVDLIYDLAFLLMDLWQRGLYEIANLVLNRYLWLRAQASDLDGLALLPLFLSLRAGVRAMVTAATLPHLQDEELALAQIEAGRYLALAKTFITSEGPRLIAVGGLSGSGKSTLAQLLGPRIGRPVGAVHLRSDIERKILFGVEETERLPSTAYTIEVTEKIYEILRQKAAAILKSGQSVIVDAVHASEMERVAIEDVAREAGVRFDGIWLEAPALVREKRVTMRFGDASDADASVILKQSTYQLGRITWKMLENAKNPEQTLQAVLYLLV